MLFVRVKNHLLAFLGTLLLAVFVHSPAESADDIPIIKFGANKTEEDGKKGSAATLSADQRREVGELIERLYTSSEDANVFRESLESACSEMGFTDEQKAPLVEASSYFFHIQSLIETMNATKTLLNNARNAAPSVYGTKKGKTEERDNYVGTERGLNVKSVHGGYSTSTINKLAMKWTGALRKNALSLRKSVESLERIKQYPLRAALSVKSKRRVIANAEESLMESRQFLIRWDFGLHPGNPEWLRNFNSYYSRHRDEEKAMIYADRNTSKRKSGWIPITKVSDNGALPVEDCPECEEGRYYYRPTKCTFPCPFCSGTGFRPSDEVN